ncbi:YdcF family protein [Hansschlegelia plantiphila]|uniref:Membrane protein n=1 Tax=Hansschlegelia plantiphila TaxID=374655 RepID=A0A9W6J420_9HYPH|nr:YdcF family protein [Hansschlegelia plantiphila]GLK69393.1 membrane protein [Hansschlegelia plantiphila]
MYFFASKVLSFFLSPSNLLVALGVIGALAWLFLSPRGGSTIMAASVFCLAIAGLSPLGNLLLIPLEERFPRAPDGEPPAGLIILGGAFDTVIAGARGDVALTKAAERLTQVAELARRWPESRIVFSGGSGTLLYDGVTEADLAARLLESFGVASDRIVLEDRSRNTVENARFTRDLVSPAPTERWFLVTSAYHMPRAVGCFREQDFPVEAWPVDYRTRGARDVVRPFSSVGAGLQRVDVAVREWVGLVSYWLLGYVSVPLPRP